MDDYDYDEADLKLQRKLQRQQTRQRTEHWHPQDPDYVEDERPAKYTILCPKCGDRQEDAPCEICTHCVVVENDGEQET